MQPLKVVFEDPDILAVYKPAGMKVHSGAGESSVELAVEQQFGKRWILLHRLDRDTTGILLFAKNREAAGEMSRAFENKQIRKSYLAVVEGDWPASLGRIDQPIEQFKDGEKVIRSACTTFRVLARSFASVPAGEGETKRSWLEVLPKTGRMHQIRIHCSKASHPICGDRLYGASGDGPAAAPLALHAHRIDFRHPRTGEPLQLKAAPPEEWLTTWLMDFEWSRVYAKLYGKAPVI